MPCLRGIELSIIIQPDSVLLPEFPHSDASSVRVASVCEAVQMAQETDAFPPGLDSPRIQKTAPRASVYVPSTPGAQFWVQYSIHRNPEPLCYLFFKLFMNGRIITSCGIKPGTASGTITRALFEPSDRWHSQEDGMLLKRSGIESRSFCFSPGPDAIAAADDGGLIEVQVFRAKSRRRTTPQLGQHRDQEQYGIISPSTGLIDHPEDASYYEWALQDATDAPYATFCFHYRAWAYLWDLNLVTDTGHPLPYNTRLREGLGRSPTKATTRGKLKDESNNATLGSNLGHNTSDVDIRATIHPHHHSQSIVPPNEEPHPLEVNNDLLSRGREITRSSAKSSKKSSSSYTNVATLLFLPPVVEEDTGSYEWSEHETMVMSPTRSLHRESLYSGFRRPLPTVNEMPKLE